MNNYLPDLQEICKNASEDEWCVFIAELPRFMTFVEAAEEALEKERERPSPEHPAFKALPQEIQTATIELIRESARIEARYQALVDAGPNRYSKQQVLEISRLEGTWVKKVDGFIRTLEEAQVPAKALEGTKSAFAQILARMGLVATDLLAQSRPT